MARFRFYSDENFALDMVEMLKALGHRVTTSYEAGQANQRIRDDEFLNYATHNSLVVITFNRDDFIELHNNGIQHAGIVICKTDRDYRGQVSCLHNYLHTQNSLVNRLIRIKRQQKRGLSIPVFIVQEYFR